jgi:hypothetical protein
MIIATAYTAVCDSKKSEFCDGRSSPIAESEDSAKTIAIGLGWAFVRNEWHCPACLKSYEDACDKAIQHAVHVVGRYESYNKYSKFLTENYRELSIPMVKITGYTSRYHRRKPE